MAKVNIASKKAFLFIPYDVIITPEKAKQSDIKNLIKAFPEILSDEVTTMDSVLWVYLMHEKFKKAKSFYYPYIEAIGNPEILSCWDDSELQELQDHVLASKAKKISKLIRGYYKSLKPVFFAFPSFFPEEP
jgi:hypothetical protein